MYGSGVTDENYLRGIVRTDGDGLAWFETIYPACCSGRWPHIHFEVYAQIALPAARTSRSGSENPPLTSSSLELASCSS